MGTDRKNQKWYLQSMQCCFDPAEKVSDVAFLKIFASLMCIPCNSNYGKKKSNRTKGSVSTEDRRDPLDVFRDQKALLDRYIDSLKTWQSEGDTRKKRMGLLADTLISTHMDSEYSYAQKNTNYKPKHYLSPCLNASDEEAKEFFLKMCDFYTLALRVIYGEDTADLARQCRAMKETVLSFLPKEALAETGNAARDMGRCLGILLMHDAGKHCAPDADECLYRVLGIGPAETCSTLSVLSVDPVTMRAAQFNLICGAALRSELKPDELMAVFEVLQWIDKKADHNLDCEIRILAENLCQASKQCLTRKSQELIASTGAEQSARLLDEVRMITKIRDTCIAWCS